ncbi:MAG: DUF92 domain-containing protein, partial [Candidatus Neomarinimicrobiota bacterium]
LIFLSEFLHNQKNYSPKIFRALIHFLVGIGVSYSPFIFESFTHPVFLAIIFLSINLFSYKNNKLKSFHDIDRDSLGTIFFPICFIILAIPFWENKYFLYSSFMILAISDPLASIIGTYYKKAHFYKISNEEKSVEGSSVMFLSTFILLFFLSRYIFNGLSFIDSVIAIFICSIFITISESISIKGSDNLSIPITAFMFIEMFNYLNEIDKIIQFSIMLFLITCSLFYFYRKRHLSLSGFLSASLMAALIIGLGGFIYLIPIITFFISSTIISKIHQDPETKILTERSVSQVLANGGIALLICVINYFYNNEILYYAFLASIAAANSDTWGTEIGKFSKINPIDILTRKNIQKGDSGGITSIGIFGSIAGSFFIGIIGFFFFNDLKYVFLISLSGFLASLFDSFLGSTFQGRFISGDGLIVTEEKKNKYYLITGKNVFSNDIVNLCCTLFAPIFFLLIHYFL